MEAAIRVLDAVKSFRETRLSTLRGPLEFFDFHRLSKPADIKQAYKRLRHNTGYFSGNYSLIVAILAVYAVITTPLLLISLIILFGGYMLITQYVDDQWLLHTGSHVFNKRSLYTGLFMVGIPFLWLSSPFMTFFWFVGASSCIIITHGCVMEPGVESEYANIEGGV